ncbi:hypothetical protein JCM14469_38580 [Desulfatiferula olefinivorans]
MTNTAATPVSREAFAALVTEARKTLGFLADLGCRGFDCSPESLARAADWGRPRRQAPQAAPKAAAPAAPAQAGPLSLEDIRRRWGTCRRCVLGDGGRSPVFGEGPVRARLMLIGDVPSAEDEACGTPFTGEAGDLLTKMIAAMGLDRDAVYLTTVLKCRPPMGRRGLPEETGACLPLLEAQIRAVNPELIVTLGAVATQALLGGDSPVAGMRGRFQSYKTWPVMPTFHPAFLLSHPDSKKDAWADLKAIMARLGLERRG